MKLLIFLLFTLVLLAVLRRAEAEDAYCVQGSYPPKNKGLIPTYHLNLDLPARERWTHIGNLQKQKLQSLLSLFKEVLLSISPQAQLLITYVDKHFESIVNWLPHPYNHEIRGLAVAADVNLGELLFYNIFYEFFTVCTSVVARDDQGHIYHARNLDFGIFMGWDTKTDKWLMSELLRTSTMHIHWDSNNKTIFKSVNFAGYIGVLTGLKEGAFAFSVNERFNLDGGFVGLLKWVMGYRQSAWLTFITRRIMETSSTYEEAKAVLTQTELIAPVYFVLSGNKSDEACVITRSRRETLDVWEIGTNGYNNSNNFNNFNKFDNVNDNINHNNNFNQHINNSKANFRNLLNNNNNVHRDTKLYFKRNNKNHTNINDNNNKYDAMQNNLLDEHNNNQFFFVLETNYDHWLQPPFYDDRRSTARHCLQVLTDKSVNFAGLFDLLSTKPMLNKLTVYTTLMHVLSGRMESFVQDCPDPCPPW